MLKYIYYVIYNWNNALTIQVSNLTTVELLLLIKSQFTKNAQNVLHMNQCTHGYVWSWTVAHFRRSRGDLEWFDMHHKCVSLHFQVELKKTRGFTKI